MSQCRKAAVRHSSSMQNGEAHISRFDIVKAVSHRCTVVQLYRKTSASPDGQNDNFSRSFGKTIVMISTFYSARQEILPIPRTSAVRNRQQEEFNPVELWVIFVQQGSGLKYLLEALRGLKKKLFVVAFLYLVFAIFCALKQPGVAPAVYIWATCFTQLKISVCEIWRRKGRVCANGYCLLLSSLRPSHVQCGIPFD